MVLTPTRELCIQVTQALRSYAEHLDVEIVAVFGGAPIKSQQAQLRSGAHVVVATVGRMMDLMSRRSLVLTAARYVVLDEADEMLDLGFIEDVEKILRMCPSGRQTALFSATMPPPVKRLAESYMYDPTTISDHAEDADRRRDRPGLRRGRGQREGGEAGRAAEDRGTRAGDHLLPHQDRRRPAGEDAEEQRPRRQGAARRHEPGLARRRDDRLQGPPRAPAGGDRHRRPRPRHRARHPRDQLRRAGLLGGLRPPHRPHRPGRQDRPRDHLRHPRPARRDRPHRARREDDDRRVGNPGGAARARAAPAPPRAPGAQQGRRGKRARSARAEASPG